MFGNPISYNLETTRRVWYPPSLASSHYAHTRLLTRTLKLDYLEGSEGGKKRGMNKKTKKTKAKTMDEIKLDFEKIDFGWEFYAAVVIEIALMLFCILGLAHLVANGFLTR